MNASHPIDEPDDATLRRWLLQTLTADDAAPLEERLLHDDAFADRVAAAETDLLDDYANGRLADDEARAMAQFRLATPAARERLRFAQALARVPRQSLPGEAARRDAAPRRRIAFAAALAAAAVLAVALVWPHSQLATFTLLARQLRDDSATRLSIPPGATAVKLQLEVEPALAGARYAVDIVGTHGPVHSGGPVGVGTTAGKRHVDVELSASALAAGTYRVRLREPDGKVAYEWTIETVTE